ncbi:hypothetical protein DU504_11890 [Haloplanus salinus]|uniref:Phage tail protein n=1 Tax=Haloplanus salinus TaxID=1126245 RepID=A0A368ND41_9EURY|nr:hypothetical protein [Haloplanus salinus]RCU47933.1 hypothetical protein DU504_11890 [Haloplanus salinus]
MAITIGNSTLPGVYVRQESNSSVGINTTAPADVGLVGEADLTNGTASANTLYTVTTAPQATRLFGDSPLGRNVVGALQNGAYPIYAVACATVDVSAEDISGLGTTSGTFENGPLVEDASTISFTVDSTSLSAVLTLDDPSSKTPASGEVYVNVHSAEFELDAAPSTSGTVDYSYLDYTTALGVMESEAGDVIDWLGILNENSDARNTLQATVGSLNATFKPTIGVVGAGTYISDTSTYTNPFDDSHMQVLYCPRNSDGESLVGAYLGVRGRIGIDQSAMRKRLSGVEGLLRNPTDTEKADLDAAHVVVIEAGPRGPRMMNDPTCVDNSNTDELAYNHGLARLLGDYITLIVEEISDPYIGRLHTPAARSALRGEVSQAMRNLLNLNAVTGFEVSVEEISSTQARLTVGVGLAKPLRNIEAVIVGGDVSA